MKFQLTVSDPRLSSPCLNSDVLDSCSVSESTTTRSFSLLREHFLNGYLSENTLLWSLISELWDEIHRPNSSSNAPPQKSLKFKTSTDASEAQIIDAMKKISSHIKNPAKFSKVAKLAFS
ncbi:hypothetical protein RYX36_028412 [Vicia faba]